MCHVIGPGPGAYKLPALTGYANHDYTRYRNPEYSFGLRPPLSFTKPCGPGPQYELCRMTRFGRAAEPQYTMAPKLPIKRETGTPGPGAHSPECVPPMREKRPPQWSMGKRVGMKDTTRSPGPANYLLPCAPSYPFYTMAKRLTSEKITSSPGPANYGLCSADVYKMKPAQYTMRPALHPKPLQSQNPGPAAYYPNLYVDRARPPQYTFGTIHACFKTPMITAEDNYPC